MSFMKPEITELCSWYEIDGNMGVEFVLFDLVGEINLDEFDDYSNHPIPAQLADYVETSQATHIQLVEGFGARMSAPGYMDCISWCVYPSIEEAKAHLEEIYSDD